MAETRTRAEIIASSKELCTRSAQLKDESDKLIAQGLVAGRPPVQLRRGNYDYASVGLADTADVPDKALQREIRENPHNVLTSWKEIAAYLKRGVRTLQRWERELDMPVRRPRQRRRSPVMAFKSELYQWLAKASIPVFSAQTDGPARQLPHLERRLLQLEGEKEIVQRKIKQIKNDGPEEDHS